MLEVSICHLYALSGLPDSAFFFYSGYPSALRDINPHKYVNQIQPHAVLSINHLKNIIAPFMP